MSHVYTVEGSTAELGVMIIDWTARIYTLHGICGGEDAENNIDAAEAKRLLESVKDDPDKQASLLILFDSGQLSAWPGEDGITKFEEEELLDQDDVGGEDEEEEDEVLHTLEDLYDYFGSDHRPEDLNRALYKNTECGASISLYGTYKGERAAIYPDGHQISLNSGATIEFTGALPHDFIVESFTIQTIIEGSDATVDSPNFEFGTVIEQDIDAWLTEMEAEAARLWKEANEDDANPDEEETK